MLNNRKIRTKLPQFFLSVDSTEIADIREKHDEKKLTQKKHFERRRKATDKEVKIGDQNLVKQTKSTTKPPFDPKPYTVCEHIPFPIYPEPYLSSNSGPGVGYTQDIFSSSQISKIAPFFWRAVLSLKVE